MKILNLWWVVVALIDWGLWEEVVQLWRWDDSKTTQNQNPRKEPPSFGCVTFCLGELATRVGDIYENGRDRLLGRVNRACFSGQFACPGR